MKSMKLRYLSLIGIVLSGVMVPAKAVGFFEALTGIWNNISGFVSRDLPVPTAASAAGQVAAPSLAGRIDQAAGSAVQAAVTAFIVALIGQHIFGQIRGGSGQNAYLLGCNGLLQMLNLGLQVQPTR